MRSNVALDNAIKNLDKFLCPAGCEYEQGKHVIQRMEILRKL
jgi:hypothetical protein